MRPVSAEKRRVEAGERSGVGSAADGSRDRGDFGRRRSSLRSCSRTSLKAEGVTGTRRKWRRVKRQKIDRMRSEWQKTR